MSQPYLVLRDITKSFPGVKALDGVCMDVRAGECHALVGENGAGKSTLMKILAGALLPDGGEIFIGGRKAEIDSPLAARHLGVSMIYQELNLLPELTVEENIFLGREPHGRLGFLDRRTMTEESRVWFERLHQQIDPRARTGDLSLAQQQMVEIVKALASRARIMIMDEPSSILTDKELEELFSLMARLKGEGLAIIYISHRLEEVFRVSERVTVLRDGHSVSTRPVSEVDPALLVKEMVGRELKSIFPRLEPASEKIAVELKGITRRPVLHDVSLHVRQGEIVGLAGLVGAGRTELARVIFGADRMEQGEIRYYETPLRHLRPHESIRRGFGFLTEDRKSQGILPDMTLRANITLANLGAVARMGFVTRGFETRQAGLAAENLHIKATSPDQSIGALSGGNQQKAILARWLFAGSRFLIFDEPTRGIDVGAKAEIYRLIADLASEGKSILVISSELPEILGLCHRIYVMREGRIAGEFEAGVATQETILATAMGVSITAP